MKKLISYILFLITGMNLFGQGSITLSTTQTTGGTQTACNQILLKPGFSYSPTGNNSLVLKVDAATCNPYGGTTESFSTTQNYILTRTYTTENGSLYLDQIQYFDGLGRPVQTVQRGITPTTKDLVALQEYDAYGRESNSWLPAVISGNNGAFVNPATIKTNAISSNGSDLKPYSLPVYEASPLNRVLKQFGPGVDWQNNSKAVHTGYLTNKAKSGTSLSLADSLVCGKYISADTRGSISISRSGNYDAGQLYVTRMKDEDSNTSYEFKDKLGQVVLNRQINASEMLDTYYVYDSYGNLKVVLPPMASDMYTSGTWTDAEANLKALAYLYRYDDRNRCTSKKLPGCNWTLYVYDKADRMIFTQDGEQRKDDKNEWTFNKYDAFGRVVVTGLQVISGKTHTDLLNLTKDVVVREEFNAGQKMGYTWNSLISVINKDQCYILSVNYYDDYKYRALSGFSASNMKYDDGSGINAVYLKRYGTDASLFEHKGLLTGTATALLDDSDTMLYSCMYYDNKKQLIQTKATNHLGGIEKEYIAYNFTGQPVRRTHIHMATGKPTQSEIYTYSYDHAGRLLKTTHQLTDGTSVKPTATLAENTYDELGRLKTSKKGGHANLNTTYAYNVRSWTKTIASPLFSQVLYYNESYGGSTKRYNGNISGMSWLVQGETNKRGYAFSYDNLSRLTAANYLKDGAVQSNNGTTPFFKTVYTYDKHGNIKTLQRYGKTTASAFGLIDNMTYDYTGTGNKLKSINDAVANITFAESADFKNYSNVATEYSYNTNGAMTKDLNKGISQIQYNSLNLPQLMDIKSPVAEARNEYTYSAGGQKLKVVQKWNPNFSTSPVIGSAISTTSLTKTKTTDYVGNMVYEDGTLKRVLVDEGYIENNVYHYYQNDHLGNNRVVANQSATVIQKNHYYPFGMAFAEGTTQEQGKQPYKYNGKELDQMHGLNMYDYSARYYESAIGRFTTVDPMAEKYYSISPYAYVMNNPMKFVDPTGEIPILVFAIPIVVKFVAGAAIDATAQTVVNMATGDDLMTAMSKIDGTEVLASGAFSSLTAPGVSTSSKLVVGTTALTMDAVSDISIANGEKSLMNGGKSISSAIFDAGTSIGLMGTAKMATSGVKNAIQSSVKTEVNAIKSLGPNGKNTVNKTARIAAIEEVTAKGEKTKSILTNGIDYGSEIIGKYKSEPKSKAVTNCVERPEEKKINYIYYGTK